MKAFISYSHVDQRFLDRLHVHLAQLQRENLISTWTDKDILAGGKLDNAISDSLSSSKLFIALLSPDYINSNYCYEKEFEQALTMEERDQLIIIPIVIEDCDWLNTPFKKFKALPEDGKAIANWSSPNTAFLNVIQEIRKLLQGDAAIPDGGNNSSSETTRNYKVKKDFDSIQKIEFQEKSFKDLSDIIRQNIDELQAIENVNGKILKSSAQEFEAILVNRNQIKSESTLNLNVLKESNSSRFMNRIDTSGHSINITIKEENKTDENISFSLGNDDYELYWLKNSPGYSIAYSQTEAEKFTIKQISEEIWEDWLNKVGINFNI